PPANTLTPIEAIASAAVGRIMSSGAPNRRSVRGSDAGCSSGVPQNTPDQILVIENSVNNPTARLAATAIHEADATPASTSANLARNPEKGGSPARLSAGTAKSTAMIGASRTSPPTSERRLEPARRLTSPVTR